MSDHHTIEIHPEEGSPQHESGFIKQAEASLNNGSSSVPYFEPLLRVLDSHEASGTIHKRPPPTHTPPTNAPDPFVLGNVAAPASKYILCPMPSTGSGKETKTVTMIKPGAQNYYDKGSVFVVKSLPKKGLS